MSTPLPATPLPPPSVEALIQRRRPLRDVHKEVLETIGPLDPFPLGAAQEATLAAMGTCPNPGSSAAPSQSRKPYCHAPFAFQCPGFAGCAA